MYYVPYVSVGESEYHVLQTYMTENINTLYIGNSTFDTNALISASCLRKILSNEQDKEDPYFNPEYYTVFYSFMEKGKNNLNNQNNNNME